ncbi:MAG: signal peptidase I [Candidatus Hydrogenedentes bacterium]|nr:signal peptidase I [Candidatus Hydrogenedentota bacterium]
MDQQTATEVKLDRTAPSRNPLITLVEAIVGPLTKENAVSWIRSIIIAVTLAVSFRYWVFDHYRIPSGSMIDTLLIGDKIIVNKFIYGVRIPFTNKRVLAIRKPQRGDIVVFRAPAAASKKRENFVKRLIALPGERVRVSNGHIYINDKLVTSPPSIADRRYTDSGSIGVENDVTVPANEIYVLGDNSPSSCDSRYWGFVPIGDIKGPAEATWWPFSHMHRLK